jgi:hypothetical protein
MSNKTILKEILKEKEQKKKEEEMQIIDKYKQKKNRRIHVNKILTLSNHIYKPKYIYTFSFR